MDAGRQTMLRGFGEVLSDEALATLDALVPKRPWREAIPADFWRKPTVMDAVNEREGRTLHQELIDVIGPAAAHVTMEYLPPVPWEVLRDHGVDHLLWDGPGRTGSSYYPPDPFVSRRWA